MEGMFGEGSKGREKKKALKPQYSSFLRLKVKKGGGANSFFFEGKRKKK